MAPQQGFQIVQASAMVRTVIKTQQNEIRNLKKQHLALLEELTNLKTQNIAHLTVSEKLTKIL